MNVRLILRLSVFGLVMGAASLLGWIHRGTEGWLWLGIGLFCAVVIAWRTTGRRFLHGFLTGLIAGTLSPLIQSVFFSTYLANNPYAAETFRQLPPSLPARLLVLLMSPVLGILSGLILGLLAWLAGKLLRRRIGSPEGAA